MPLGQSLAKRSAGFGTDPSGTGELPGWSPVLVIVLSPHSNNRWSTISYQIGMVCTFTEGHLNQFFKRKSNVLC